MKREKEEIMHMIKNSEAAKEHNLYEHDNKESASQSCMLMALGIWGIRYVVDL